jgi:hypothetical protein
MPAPNPTLVTIETMPGRRIHPSPFPAKAIPVLVRPRPLLPFSGAVPQQLLN